MAFDPFAVFTGAPLEQAGADTRQAFADMTSKVNALAGGAMGPAIDALKQGQTSAVGALTGGTGQARSDILSMLDPSLRALYGGQSAAQTALAGSVDPSLAALGSGVSGAVGAFNPLLMAGTNYGGYGDTAAQMYSDALGLGGPAGNARATGAFQAGPGYQFALDQAIKSATRGANATGMGASGNTLDALVKLGTNYGNQEYGNWLDRTLKQASLYSPLQAQALGQFGTGAGNAFLTGGTGAANIISGTGSRLADLYSNTGRTASGIYTGAGTSLADLASTGGTNLANIYSTTGGNIANLINSLTGQQIGFQQAQLAPTQKSFEDAGLASMLGSQNLWNFGLNAVKAGAGAGAFNTP